jgi:hypothetical protein
MRLVGALLDLERRLAAVLGEIDQLQAMNLPLGIRRQRDERAIVVVGVRQEVDGWRERRGRDAAAAQVGLHAGACRTVALTRDRIDVVIAEIKTGRCALNGPWTDPGRRNMQRVLAAIGVVPQARIGEAAAALYEHGYFEADAALRVRLVAVGSRTDEDINTRYPRVSQVTWPDALRFIYRRLRRYRDQKSDTQHWNSAGHLLKRHVNRYSRSEDDFIAWATGAMTPAPSEGG